MATAALHADGGTAFEVNEDVEQPDIWIADSFENRYGDQRVVLDGDTYEAKEIIKFDWDTTHHDFDDNRKAWIVDADAIPELSRRLEAGGFDLGEVQRDRFFQLHEYVEHGDDIRVEYEKKNTGEPGEYEGRVVEVGRTGQGNIQIQFRRHDDDHWMRIERDKYGKVALFTGGSHAPFVGQVDRVVVDADREIEEPAPVVESESEPDFSEWEVDL